MPDKIRKSTRKSRSTKKSTKKLQRSLSRKSERVKNLTKYRFDGDEKYEDVRKFDLPSFMSINDKDLPYYSYPSTSIIDSFKSLFGYYNDEDDRDWISHRERLLSDIYQLFKDDKDEYTIPVGTRLYHGTKNENFIKDIPRMKNHMTFLGLEPIISIWYTAEEIGHSYNDQLFSYVYEFIVEKPIKIDKIIKYITLNPALCDICTRGGVCVHPQITFHNENEEGPLDLSVEVTLMLKKLFNEGFLKISNRYRTSIVNLDNMLYYPLSKLDLYLQDDLFILWPKQTKNDLKTYIQLVKQGNAIKWDEKPK